MSNRQFRVYRCPVDGQIYAAVEGVNVHPGLAAVRNYASNPHSPMAKQQAFWALVLAAMEAASSAAHEPSEVAL